MAETTNKTFPPVFPHQAIQAIADDLFMARGSIGFNRFVRLSRNMAIVRSGNELTLIDPIRLNERGLRDLDALGVVKHIVRLGGGHGSDDPFYVDRYRALLWAQEGGQRYPEPAIDPRQAPRKRSGAPSRRLSRTEILADAEEPL